MPACRGVMKWRLLQFTLAAPGGGLQTSGKRVVVNLGWASKNFLIFEFPITFMRHSNFTSQRGAHRPFIIDIYWRYCGFRW
ncbi:hypothetical protein B0O99DRAFT_631893 [Bisporella sp. PMI_857]|nr:hypothetical protein B0O99DRAFT_631893 [Bisporella sp. PMI_857]